MLAHFIELIISLSLLVILLFVIWRLEKKQVAKREARHLEILAKLEELGKVMKRS